MPEALPEKPPQADLRPLWPWGVLLLILLFVVAVRLRALSVPLERDEGEYAYIGQLILQGVAPYKLAYAMKLPGTYLVYALVMAVFGQTAAAIHMGLLLANAAAILFVFLIARQLFDAVGGLVAAAFYMLITLGPALYGTSAHANHFVVLFALAGVLVLLRAIQSERLAAFFGGGVLFGLAFVMKQHGVVFVLFALAYLSLHAADTRPINWRQYGRRIAALLAGAAAPYVVTCGVLAAAGVFKDFWFWTFTNPQNYATKNTPQMGWQLLALYFRQHAWPTIPLWVFAGAGLLWVIGRAQTRGQRRFIVLWTFFSAVGASIGFYFRPHYFVLLAPALALAAGGFVSTARQTLASRGWPKFLREAPLIVFAGVCVYVTAQQAGLFFKFSPAEMSRAAYGGDFLMITEQVGEHLRAVSRPDARIAVLGSEPQICFYANRRSATGFIYMYDLMTEPRYALELQRRMIQEIESTRPEFGVLIVAPHSWLFTPLSETTVVDWSLEYFEKYYRPIGVIDFISDGETFSLWGEKAADYILRGKEYIFIYQRRAEAPIPANHPAGGGRED
jgi:4-amino-4-deoxy-L-arabinose transferase-like glycosyltransferase